MGRNLVETVMGAVVLLIAGFFLVFAYDSSDLKPVRGYAVTAKFNSIAGLDPGSDVRVGGVKVGSVVDMRLDPEDYRAVVTLNIIDSVKLPVDTAVSITGDGLLGGKYVDLKPGRSKTMVAVNGQLAKTKDVVAVEELLAKAIFLLSDEATKSN